MRGLSAFLLDKPGKCLPRLRRHLTRAGQRPALLDAVPYQAGGDGLSLPGQKVFGYEEIKHSERYLRRLVLGAVFGGAVRVLLFWSMLQPFGAPPDEMERFKIVSYLVNHGRLPHGGDPEIMLDGWGFSYGFQPILPYIVDAFFLKAFGLFSDSVYLSFVRQGSGAC